jgi:transcription elongation factor GreA
MASEETIPLTPEGFVQLTEELRKLKDEERPRVIQDIAEARAHGDLKENAEYAAAKEKQGFVEARILELEGNLTRARVIDFRGQNIDQVRIGAYVTVRDEESGDEKKMRIVGDLEADISKNKVSLSSPIGKALIGKKVDDVVEVQVPKGRIEYAIAEIKY